MKDAFKDAKTILEVYSIARQLKANGEDPSVVNTMVAAKKKELILSCNKITTLEKQVSVTPIIVKDKVTTLRLAINDLTSGIIRYHEDGLVEI